MSSSFMRVRSQGNEAADPERRGHHHEQQGGEAGASALS